MIERFFKYGMFITLIVVYSCAVGPNFKPAEVNEPEDFRFSVQEDSIININWWEVFKDPVLDSLIFLALDNNRDVLIASSRVEQARAVLGVSKANFGPAISYSGNIARTNYLQNIKLDEVSGIYSAQAGLKWEIDLWGRIRRSNESARASLLASVYGKRAVQLSLISEMASSYYDLLDYRTRLIIAENTFKVRDSALAIIKLRYEKGIIPLLDVNQAEIQSATAQVAIPFYRRQIAYTEHRLKILLGDYPGEIPTPTMLLEKKLPDSLPVGLPSDLLLRRPDIMASQYDYWSQHARIGVAEALRFPTISLTGVLGYGSPELTNLISNGLGWGIGGSFVGPLFEWGKNKRRVDVEREATKQALMTYENTVLNAFREVDDALIAVQTLKEELAIREVRYKAAESASYLSGLRYDKGVTSYLEVVENQRQTFGAKLEYSQTYKEVFLAYINLYKALGGGWISERERDEYARKYEQQLNLEEGSVKRDTLIYKGQFIDIQLSNGNK
ncbi:efflux transporter outer membrane subunit [Mangrovimonas aestuarii]|uniref:efflux transporter outer membrane subunit n=1 Tax=Mangrovimonas aestuarii TaxID=3018443 RepID=UPI00237968AC|nr:efflux transporter outer membrane subunit [Mangrovimonas aestuarii]